MSVNALAWFKTGTVSVVNGSPIVTGVGTDWTFGEPVRPGDIFSISGSQLYEIATINSDTSITLVKNYSGVTAGTLSYVIIRNFAATPSASLVAKQMEMLAYWQSRETELGTWQVAPDSGVTATPTMVSLTNFDGTVQNIRSLPQTLGDIQRAIDSGNVGPVGPGGLKGDPGEGLEWQPGGWSATHGTYFQADAVAHGGHSWVCLISHTPGTLREPGVGANYAVYWELLAQGATGVAGSKWFNGTTVPSSGLGLEGDFYVRNTTGDFYKKISGSWQLQGQIAGPAGPAGPSTAWYSGAGPPTVGLGADGDFYLNASGGDVYKKTLTSWGAPVANIGGSVGPGGEKGSIWLVGTGAPLSLTGDDEDMYLDDSNGNYYKKIAGSWGPSLGTLRGPTGNTGATGTPGTPGTNGTDGTDGTDGKAILSGTIAPSDIQGVDGDYYFNSSNGDMYKKVSAAWGAPIFNLSGVDGIDGTQVFSGTTTPNDLIGNDNDHYLNALDGDWHKKVAGTWGVAIGNLKGPQGIQGNQGDKGDKGNQGDKGNPGASMSATEGVPTSDFGIDDQVNVDTLTGDIYKKFAGFWGAPIGNILGPIGPIGPVGPPGGINWISANWAPAVLYTKDDALEAGGVAYVCILTHTSSASNEPGVGASYNTYWDLFASGGAGSVSSVAGRTGAITLFEADITNFGSYALSNHAHSMNDLTDAQIASIQNLHLMIYSAINGRFENRALLQSDISDFGSFALSVHEHGIPEVTGLQAALDGKSGTGHAHPVGGLTDVQSITPANRQALLWNSANLRYENRAILTVDISDFGNYSLVGHTHTIANVTSLQSTLDGKINVGLAVNGLADVSNSAPANKHALLWNSANSRYENRALLQADISDFGTYALATHNHTGVYEPAFTKLTGFNKNFGTAAGTVAEGNHNHNTVYSLLAHTHTIASLSDFTVSSPATGEVLVKTASGYGHNTLAEADIVQKSAPGLSGVIVSALDARAARASGTETFNIGALTNAYLPVSGANVTIAFTRPASNVLNGVTNIKIAGSILVQTTGNFSGLAVSGLSTNKVSKGTPPSTTGEFRILKYEFFKTAGMEFMWAEWTDPT